MNDDNQVPPDWLPQERRKTPIAEDSLALMAFQITVIAQRVELLTAEMVALNDLLPDIKAMARLLRWWRTTAELAAWLGGALVGIWALVKFLWPSLEETLK